MSIVIATTRPIAKQLRGRCLSMSLSNRHKGGRIWLRATPPTVPPPTAPAPAQPGGRTPPCQKPQGPITTSLRGCEGKEGMRKRLHLETAELPNVSLRNWADDKDEGRLAGNIGALPTTVRSTFPSEFLRVVEWTLLAPCTPLPTAVP